MSIAIIKFQYYCEIRSGEGDSLTKTNKGVHRFVDQIQIWKVRISIFGLIIEHLVSLYSPTRACWFFY